MSSEMSQKEKQRLFKKGQKILDRAKKSNFHKNLQSAKDNLGEAKAIFQKIEAPLMEAKVYEKLGQIQYQNGEWEPSIKDYKIAMTIYDEFQQIPQKAKIMVEIGRVMVHLKWYDEALEYVQKAHDSTEQLGQKDISLQSVFLLGSIYQLKKDYQSALFYYNLARDYLQGMPNMKLQFQVNENLGMVLCKLGKFQESNQVLLEIIQQEQMHSRYPSLLRILGIMGENYLILGNKKKALGYLYDANHIARKIFEQNKTAEMLLNNLLSYAKNLNYLMKMGLAEEICEEAIILAEETNNKLLLARGLTLMARIIATKPKQTDATNQTIKSYLNEAETIAQPLNDKQIIIEISLAKAYRMKQQGFEQAVINLLVEIDSSIKNTVSSNMLSCKGEVKEQLGIIYHQLDRHEEALLSFQIAIKIFLETNEFGLLAESYYNAACVACLQHLPEETIIYLEKSVEINPKYKKIALTDQDFRSIRSTEPFKNIVD